MMSTLCADFETRGVVERYVAGTSTARETEQLERHLLGCRGCQRAVRLGSAVRAELRSSRSGSSANRSRWRRRSTLVACGLLAATVVAVAGSRVANRNALRQLGVVASLPEYAGIAVRSYRSAGDSLFAEGMRLYGERRIEEATMMLQGARARGADSVPSSFFLGVLLLMRDQPIAAQRELLAVLRHGDTPYAAEAHFFLAKAWLRRGNRDSARVHLREAASSALPVSRQARALDHRLSGATR